MQLLRSQACLLEARSACAPTLPIRRRPPQVSGLVAHAHLTPSCPGPPLFWLREASLTLAPWSALLALALPLPMRWAAPVAACVAALGSALTGHRRGVSTALCRAADGMYAEAVRRATAWLSPPTLADVAPDAAAAYWAVHVAAHAATAAATLQLLCRRERRQRRAFLAARRAAAPGPSSAARAPRLRSPPRGLDASDARWAAVTAVCAVFCLGTFWAVYPAE